jgi:hypothetical protein
MVRLRWREPLHLVSIANNLKRCDSLKIAIIVMKIKETYMITSVTININGKEVTFFLHEIVKIAHKMISQIKESPVSLPDYENINKKSN